MKETSCNIPIISSSSSPCLDSTVEGSHPSGWSWEIRLQLQPQPVALCPLLTIFSLLWTLWTLSLSTPTCLHLRYLWPFPFSVSCPAPSISLSSTLSFLVIPPSSSNNTQPSECSGCTFVTDILGRVAIPFLLILHGWLKPSVASDPYCWQHFTLTPPSELLLPPHKDLCGLACSAANGFWVRAHLHLTSSCKHHANLHNTYDIYQICKKEKAVPSKAKQQRKKMQRKWLKWEAASLKTQFPWAPDCQSNDTIVWGVLVQQEHFEVYYQGCFR